MGLDAILRNSGDVLSPIKRHLSYVFQFESEAQFLEMVVEQLKRESYRVAQSVEVATRNGEEISADVKSWQSDVRKELTDADELIRSCVGVCPNLKTCYQLGKKVYKKASIITLLLWNSEGIYRIVESSVPLPSRLQFLDQIVDAVKDPELNVIGVYGMGGVGKTMLAMEVQAKAKQEKMFDSVVLVAVSQTPEVERIQSEIAEVLGMKFDVEEVPERASKLHRKLEESKVLIILDDMCHKLDLDAVGIPDCDSLNNCKLLLISREVDVLYEMGTEDEFCLGVLGELFCALAPKASDPQFQDMATKVSKQCAGLPLLINIAAKEVQNKELKELKNVLKKISIFRNEGLQAWKGMSKQQPLLNNKDTHQRVNNFLAKSSENQHVKKMKSLLLLCLMFARSKIEIQRLLIYSMGLGLFENADSVREARNSLFALINELKSDCYLFDGDMDGFVKMDDSDWSAAISNASMLNRIFVGDHVPSWNQLDRKCTKISLPYCNVSELPSLDCPEADLFLLFTKDQGLKIPHSFFHGMKNLKFVDFTGMCFTSLPSSLCSLKNLQTLSLQRCQLHSVSFIGKMKQLQQLSFAYSSIVRLPEEMEELTQLKLLDLSYCTKLQVIPAHVLSKLSHLQELYMLASFKRWNTEGNARLEELEDLDQLSSLEIQIENPKIIPGGGLGFFDGLNLKHFKISVSEELVGVVNEASHS